MKIHLIGLLLSMGVLAACGGSDTSNTNSNGNTTANPPPAPPHNPNNREPVAQDKSLTLAYNSTQQVVVSATDADNDALTYTIVTQPHYGKLMAVSGKPGTFTYTPIKKYIGIDKFSFTANDGQQTSNTATVKLTYWSNTWPIADAGTDQLVYENTEVLISGEAYNEGSSAYDDQGNKLPLHYQWQQTDSSGLAIQLMDANKPTLRIKTPDVDTETTLRFRFRVSNSQGLQATDQVSINIKPLSGIPRVMLGAYLPSDAWNTHLIDQYNADTGMPLSIINLFTSFENDWQSLSTLVSNVRAHNAMPLITWMPQLGSQPTAKLLPAIARGEWDAYINQWIVGLKQWQGTYPADNQPQVLIRFGHEFNGTWYPWGNDPDNFQAAWRHIHNRFTAAQVKNVKWVWCMNNFSFDDAQDVTRYYPGDAYVDWTAINGYNWGSNIKYVSWNSFSSLIGPAYTILSTQFPTKPIMIAEVASAEPADQPNPAKGMNGDDSDAHESKPDWVNGMFTDIEQGFPHIRALLWFNQDRTLRWALNGENHTGIVAYREAVSRTHYFGGAYRDVTGDTD